MQDIQTNREFSFLEAEEIPFSEESVEASVSLSSLAHEASESNNALLASNFAVLVNLKYQVRKKSLKTAKY